MHLKKSLLALAITLACGGVAQADNVLSVTATYDTPVFQGNSSITVTNTSSSVETNVDINAGGFTISLGTIQAGQSATYDFNAASGPFIVDPGDKDLPDTTEYDVTATYQGSTVTSNPFDQPTNLTGQYIDFLGVCANFEIECSDTSPTNPPLTGVVAAAAAPVPLSPSLAFLFSGLAGLAARSIRRRA